MTKQEWIEYFQAVNGRKPSPKDLQDAVLNGDVDVENTLGQQQNQSIPDQNATNPQMNYYQQPVFNNQIKKKNPLKIIIPVVLIVFIIGVCGLYIIGVSYNNSEQYAYQQSQQNTDNQGSEQQPKEDNNYRYLEYDIKYNSTGQEYENNLRDDVYIMSGTDITQEEMDLYVSTMYYLDDYWSKAYGGNYIKPRLVVYTDPIDLSVNGEDMSIESTCYFGGTVFIKTSQMYQIAGTSKAARVFVVAHEVGHHIQNLLTDLDMVYQRQYKMEKKGDKVGSQRLSIRCELQADYYAGTFCRYLNKISKDSDMENISPDDIVDIIASANNIGDDVKFGDDYSAEVSDHGTAEQRKRWFWHGYNDENFSRQKIYDLRDDQL
jgi:hypothetical protein